MDENPDTVPWFLQRPADDTSNDGPPFLAGQVASVLHHVGVLLELQGEHLSNPVHLNGSRTIGSLQESLHDLVATGRLLEIKGIGKGLGGAISDAVMEGRWPDEWYDLERSVPSGLIDLLDVPNLGPKRIRILNQELGVTSVEELESACASGEVEGLKGFGAKSQQRYLDGIELLRRFRSRRRLDIGLRYGEALERRIRSMDGVLRATLAGSARRRKERSVTSMSWSRTIPIITVPSVKPCKASKGSSTSKVRVRPVGQFHPRCEHLQRGRICTEPPRSEGPRGDRWYGI